MRLFDLDGIGADVLRDAARFALGDARLADGVEQRGLAVIDVAHDRDDRRARHAILGLGGVGLDLDHLLFEGLHLTSAPNSRAIIVAVSVSSVV